MHLTAEQQQFLYAVLWLSMSYGASRYIPSCSTGPAYSIYPSGRPLIADDNSPFKRRSAEIIAYACLAAALTTVAEPILKGVAVLRKKCQNRSHAAARKLFLKAKTAEAKKVDITRTVGITELTVEPVHESVIMTSLSQPLLPSGRIPKGGRTPSAENKHSRASLNRWQNRVNSQQNRVNTVPPLKIPSLESVPIVSSGSQRESKNDLSSSTAESFSLFSHVFFGNTNTSVSLPDSSERSYKLFENSWEGIEIRRH